MNRLLRAVVTCLLLVALPLQGNAASMATFCGGGPISGGLEQHHDRAAHSGDAAHQHDRATASPDDGDTVNLHHAAHGKCSVCASCCSAAALPPVASAAPADAPRGLPFPDVGQASPRQDSARLDRPPRLTPA